MIHKARLDGVAQTNCQHEVAAAAADVVGDGQRHAEIVRRVAGFGLGQEVVHEIDVTNERGVPERRVEWICAAAADERAWTGATELRYLLATGLDRAGAEGGDAAPHGVENVNWQLRTRLARYGIELGASGIFGERFNLSHAEILRLLGRHLLGCE